MDIGFYIADLLRNQDEVSLPGLGTFTKERVAGSYDISSNSFRPPSYQVSFNRKLNDFNSLSEHISAKKNLSPSSAEYFVKKFTSALLDLLQTSGTAEVKPLGIIRQNEDNITFEASSSFNVAGKFYGLKPIAEIKDPLPPSVIETSPQGGNDSGPLTEPVSPPKGSFIEDFIAGQGSEEQEEEEEYVEEPRGSRTLLVILGAVLLVIITTALLYLFNPAAQTMLNGLFSGTTSAVYPAQVPDTNTKATTPVLTDSVNAQATAVQKIATDSLASPIPAPAEGEREAVEITTYEIVGATFGKRSEAENYIKTMKGKGIQARILENMPGTLYKVSLASFPDYKTAQNELNRIVKEVEKSAWTTKYKSKKIQ